MRKKGERKLLMGLLRRLCNDRWVRLHQIHFEVLAWSSVLDGRQEHEIWRDWEKLLANDMMGKA
jgi:hypothetical protein